ncbi:MAG: carbohydrate kinase [Clostridia bacterium]|nr:carbohydrate kinase [Clostridia bacterium]
MAKVVALGELLIDFAQISVDDKGYPTMKANPGGAPCNYLAALAKYGVSTDFIGKVGDDAFGKMLVNTLNEANIGTNGIVFDENTFTTLAFVTNDERGDRSFSFARKPGADTCLEWDEVDKSLIDQCEIFHFGTLSLTDEPSKSATEKAVAYAKEQGKLISFDPNLRRPLWKNMADARKAIEWGLHQADIVKISDEEVAYFWRELVGEYEAIYLMRNMGVKLIMVTKGAQGALIANVDHIVEVKAPSVNAIDTTGAGDIFGGSAVARFLETGKPADKLTAAELEYIGKYAATAASLSTEKQGGIPSVPDKNTVLEKMAAEE